MTAFPCLRTMGRLCMIVIYYCFFFVLVYSNVTWVNLLGAN